MPFAIVMLGRRALYTQVTGRCSAAGRGGRKNTRADGWRTGGELDINGHVGGKLGGLVAEAGGFY